MVNGTDKLTARKFSAHNVLVVDDHGLMTSEKVVFIDGETIETEEGIYKIEDTTKFFNVGSKGFTFLVNCDVPAKVNAQELKKLRRSSVINNIMNYEGDKKDNVMIYLLVAVLIVSIIW